MVSPSKISENGSPPNTYISGDPVNSKVKVKSLCPLISMVTKVLAALQLPPVFVISKSKNFHPPLQVSGFIFRLGLFGLMSKSTVLEISTSLTFNFLQLSVSTFVIVN